MPGLRSSLPRYKFFVPFFHAGRHRAFQKVDESAECFSRIANQEVKCFPVVAVLSVVVGNHVLEVPSFLQFAEGTQSTSLNVFQIARREFVSTSSALSL